MQHALALLVVFVSWLATLCTVLLVAGFLDVLGCAMSWYSRPWLLVGLYGCPALLTLLKVHSLARSKLYKVGAT